ncbi:hypothetical protein [Quadrisphaera sp. DSM 44207]|uniref:hypothetical protein n=1 Tax=Quadrisphaera sp. DSM 44207 TaxID=1881057 RepID=UPI00087E46B0|nr:hypothetical protein [Quadrisphaera sp. DSM 44207]SDQ73972.1 hypothetical protein SAMN05428996_2617 [Quadrisphaera sp. DSM 44207]
MRRLALPRPVALAVLVLGLLAALAALALTTVARPTQTLTATAAPGGRAPLVLTAPGVLESRPGPVTVTARGEGDVLLAVGREDDVLAWAGDAARTTLTRLSGPEVLAVETAPGASTAPDPEGSDLWVQEASGQGSASLTHDAPDGAWLLLVAGDGTGPAPQEVSLAWQEEAAPTWALPVLVAGLLLALLGAASLLARRRPAPAPAAQEPVPVGSRPAGGREDAP